MPKASSRHCFLKLAILLLTFRYTASSERNNSGQVSVCPFLEKTWSKVSIVGQFFGQNQKSQKHAPKEIAGS